MRETAQETQIERYLLGKLADAEMEALEERFFADNEAFLELQAAEMSLVDRYVRNEMSDAERMSFEANYLISAERKARVDASRVFHKELSDLQPSATAEEPQISWTERLRRALSLPVMQHAGAAVIALLAISTTWLFVDRSQTRNDLLLARNAETELTQRLSQREQELNERLAEQRGQDSESLSALQNDVESLREQLDAARKTGQRANTNSDIRQTPLIATVLLSASRGGGGGAIPTVEVSKDVKVLNIKVPISSGETGKFDVQVSSGDKVLLKRTMTATQSNGGWILNISIPAMPVAAGRCTVAIRSESGEVTTRSFIVMRN